VRFGLTPCAMCFSDCVPWCANYGGKRGENFFSAAGSANPRARALKNNSVIAKFSEIVDSSFIIWRKH